MASPIEILKNQIKKNSTSKIPRGELWLGTDLLKASGLEDTVDGHVALATQLDHAVVCFSVSDEGSKTPDLGYRYFTVPDIGKAVAISDKPVVAVVDGPFQEMVNTMGLMDVLAGWAAEREEIIDAYHAESEKRLALILKVLEHRPAALVLTDDMAFDTGPLFSPDDINDLCGPFYNSVVKHIHACNIPVLLHSCGNITQFIPIFKAWNIDGFAAIQSGLNDIVDIYRQFDGDIMVMAGIENNLLDADPFPEDELQKLEAFISVLGASDSLILSSSCGLYKGEYLRQIQKIYTISDSDPS